MSRAKEKSVSKRVGRAGTHPHRRSARPPLWSTKYTAGSDMFAREGRAGKRLVVGAVADGDRVGIDLRPAKSRRSPYLQQTATIDPTVILATAIERLYLPLNRHSRLHWDRWIVGNRKSA